MSSCTPIFSKRRVPLLAFIYCSIAYTLTSPLPSAVMMYSR
jgi:hypothetical protein